MTDIVEVVVVRVLRHPPVEVGPGQNVLQTSKVSERRTTQLEEKTYHRILLVLDGLYSNLRQEVVVQHVRREMALDR